MEATNMTLRRSFVPVLILSILVQSALVVAQTSDWTRVKGLSTGTRVRVESKTGQKADGTLDSVDDGGIAVNVNGSVRRFAMADVKKVHLREKGSVGKSVAIGAGIGAGVGAGIGFGVLGATGGSDDTGGVLGPIIAAGAGVGALIGGVLGRNKSILIYEAR